MYFYEIDNVISVIWSILHQSRIITYTKYN